jgi:crotonobetainyl-CoA:carnitine CoA-transferase CaiB-like acyl-CoA transferase
MVNQAELNENIERWTVDFNGVDLVRRLVMAKVRAGLLNDARDALRDPQLNYRHQFVYLDHPVMGYHVYNTSPVHMSKTPAVLDQAASLLGEHTKQVLQDLLNMDDATFEDLQKDGVFK